MKMRLNGLWIKQRGTKGYFLMKLFFKKWGHELEEVKGYIMLQIWDIKG